ncbi:FAD-dependent monooxygenase [Neorhizobium sp. DT-125]|uniref:FAD-dependent monooxygenase n=1 Tax=Neorhizobium sp. DT-125 TaxID=3396163 RepID=UPI003F1B834B
MDDDGSQSGRRFSVLISGASIAGPTLAYWLSRYGFNVTVVERSEAVRGGGYAIDVRGTAVDVVDQMGIYPQLQAAHIGSREITFLNPDGDVAGRIRPEELTGSEEGRDIELPRGNLTELLFALTQRESIQYLFNDSIESIKDDGNGVDVTFKNSEPHRFDVVIGADGLHSNTRRLIFGPEEPFSRYLGYCFNGFTMPNFLGLSHESIAFATPGRFAVLSASGDTDTLHAFLTFASEAPPITASQDEKSQRRLTAEMFAGVGWEVPRLVDALQKADDFYYDVVSQIHLEQWSKGRVGLVGDSAFAPSFLSGQGSSIALVGAYILAGELAINQDPTRAFASYEKLMRPFAEANQALAGSGASFLLPRTEDELNARNRALAGRQAQGSGTMPGDDSRTVHSSLRLPDYSAALVPEIDGSD